ncbi:MAG: TolB family protein, partial [Blastocatellia bacterium]
MSGWLSRACLIIFGTPAFARKKFGVRHCINGLLAANFVVSMNLSDRRNRKAHTMRRTWIVAALLAVGFVASSTTGRGETPAGVRSVSVDHGAADPAVSPDGTRIAASILGKIWILPSAGGDAGQISRGISWDTHPAWSPDGQFLAYAHELPSGADLVIQNLATGTASVLYHTKDSIGPIEYGPKGGEIFFIRQQSQLDAHLWRISVSGGEPKPITETQNWHEWTFALSPDGNRAFLDSGRYGGSNLYQIELADRKATRLSNTPWNQSSVAWSRDGKTLYYIETDNGVDSIMAMPAVGGEARRVFSSPYDDKELALAPDGTTAVICAARKLYRLSLDSGRMQPIPFT